VRLLGRTGGGTGARLNTRGLLGPLDLNVGLGLKVIAPAQSAMPVLLALAPTLAPAPALHSLTARPAVRGDTVC
jgi:hypothetical protein